MSQDRTMILHEELEKQIPVTPNLVQFYKNHLELMDLLQIGWNLSKVVEELGPEFIKAGKR
jgi:hypothetical protein